MLKAVPRCKTSWVILISAHVTLGFASTPALKTYSQIHKASFLNGRLIYCCMLEEFLKAIVMLDLPNEWMNYVRIQHMTRWCC